MQQFSMTWATDTDTTAVVERCLAQLGDVPEAPVLGFVYADHSLAERFGAIIDALQARHPQVHWYGTVGMGLCTSGVEHYEEPTLALMVTDIPRERFLPIDTLPGGADAVEAWARNRPVTFGFVHGDPTEGATLETLETLTGLLDNGFINGGLSSSANNNPQAAGGLSQTPLSGFLLDEQVPVVTDHSQGCTPIGPVHDVSEAQHNVLVGLDRRPALQVMKEDMGEVLARDLSRVGGYIFAALPIPGSDTGDYLVRNLIALDTQRELIAVGEDLSQTSQLMFCRRDGNTAREDMQRMLSRIARRVDGRTIRGGVYVSCLGRGRNQFGKDSEELHLIHEQLGDFPLVGFFANGEIYNGRLYGYTGVLTLFL